MPSLKMTLEAKNHNERAADPFEFFGVVVSSRTLKFELERPFESIPTMG